MSARLFFATATIVLAAVVVMMVERCVCGAVEDRKGS